MTCKWNWQMFACETLKLDLDNSWKFVRSDVQLRAGFAFGLALQAKLLFFFFLTGYTSIEDSCIEGNEHPLERETVGVGHLFQASIMSVSTCSRFKLSPNNGNNVQFLVRL